jgi:hypothetical protein
VATLTGNQTKHATLTTTTVDQITLTGAGSGRFEVVNRDGTNTVWVTYSRTGTPVDPVASADDAHVLPPNSSKEFYTFGSNNLIVKILGNGGAYSVEALDG